MDAYDVPDRLIPPHWSPAQVVGAGFAAASTAAGLLVTVTTGRPTALGLTVAGLLTFALIPTRRAVGPYLVVIGTILLQVGLLCRSEPPGSGHFPASVSWVYGIAGLAAVTLGCVYCRIWASRHRRAFFGHRRTGDT